MRGEIIKSGGVVFPNGEPVKPGEQMTCGSCGKGIEFPPQIADISEVVS